MNTELEELRKPHHIIDLIQYHLVACLESELLLDEDHSAITEALEMLAGLGQQDSSRWLPLLAVLGTIGSTFFTTIPILPYIPMITYLANSSGMYIRKMQSLRHKKRMEKLNSLIKMYYTLQRDVNLYLAKPPLAASGNESNTRFPSGLHTVGHQIEFIRTLQNKTINLCISIVNDMKCIASLVCKYDPDYIFILQLIVFQNYRIEMNENNLERALVVFTKFLPVFSLITSTFMYITSIALIYYVQFKDDELVSLVLETTHRFANGFEPFLKEGREIFNMFTYNSYDGLTSINGPKSIKNSPLLGECDKLIDRLVEHMKTSYQMTVALRKQTMPPSTNISETQGLIRDINNCINTCCETLEHLKQVSMLGVTNQAEVPNVNEHTQSDVIRTERSDPISTIRCDDVAEEAEDETYEGISQNDIPDILFQSQRDLQICPADIDAAHNQQIQAIVNYELKCKLKQRGLSPIITDVDLDNHVITGNEDAEVDETPAMQNPPPLPLWSAPVDVPSTSADSFLEKIAIAAKQRNQEELIFEDSVCDFD